MNKQTLVIAGMGVAVIALIFWIIKRTEISPIAPTSVSETPKMTNEEASSQAAAERAAAYLESIRNSPFIPLIVDQTDSVRQREIDLAAAEREALLTNNPEQQKETTQLEALARTERAKLESLWTSQLSNAVTAMNNAKSQAVIAVSNYQTALSRVLDWEVLMEKSRNGIVLTNTQIQLATNTTVRTKLLADLASYQKLHSTQSAERAKAQIVANTCHINANSAICSANDACGDVQSITRDLLNLGILLELANRTDVLAQATREKIHELEAKL